MKMAILELEYKNIRKITALKLPFTKADGSVISNNFIMMANGTGKTTTMELIKGLSLPKSKTPKESVEHPVHLAICVPGKVTLTQFGPS